MSFKKRAINVMFVPAGGKAEVLDLSGLRCEALVQNAGGNMMMGTLQLRVFGMKDSDMNRYATNGLNATAVKGDQIMVSAGDEGGIIRQIFSGTIFGAYSDFQTAPDVCFNVAARAAFLHKVMPAAPNSYKGSVDVATVIGSLAKQMGFAFKNNGVTAKISNPYLYGALIDQIEQIAHASSTICSIENDTICIWPNKGLKDDHVIDISADTGMAGYPEWQPATIKIKTEFNPEITNGRKARLTSIIPRANGEWVVQNMMHDLSTNTPDGHWFTVANLTQQSLYISWNQ